MQNFRTEVSVKPSPFKITHKSKILTIGSCFSDNIGNKLNELKFKCLTNPFGVLYNPASINQNLNLALKKQLLKSENLFEHKTVWSSFYFHSTFSSPDQDSALESINQSINNVHEHLQGLDFIFLTYGTAWIYQLKSNNKIVSNCHKLPANHFNRKRLTVNEIIDLTHEYLTQLYNINPNLKVIFTISPIRHWKDGATENQISKSTLFLAIDELQKNTNTAYFPAYELLMDDLRDYRFYNDDMLHPSPSAIDYIWRKFQQCFFDDETILVNKKIASLNQAINHRPFNPDSKEHLKFKAKLKGDLAKFRQDYPNINF